MALQAIPGAWATDDGATILGGGAAPPAVTTLYSGDGTLAANRDMDMDGKTLTMSDSGTVGRLQVGGLLAASERIAAVGTNATSASISGTRYANSSFGPKIFVAHARGTEAAPAALTDNNQIGRFLYLGHDGTGFFDSAEMRGQTTEVWTNIAHGCELIWFTIPNGSVSQTESMRLEQDGRLVCLANVALDSANPTLTVGDGAGSPSVVIDALTATGTAALDFQINGVNQASFAYSASQARLFLLDAAGTSAIMTFDEATLKATAGGDLEITDALEHKGTDAGFYGTTPITKPSITTADAVSIISALSALGLVSDDVP